MSRGESGPGLRTLLTDERSRTAKRLEEAGIKLSCLATDIMRVSGRAMWRP
jgi:hypothetical protein